jgi:hypothetical protein
LRSCQSRSVRPVYTLITKRVQEPENEGTLDDTGHLSNGYHPELHPWLPRLDELMAAGVPEREALAQAMAESNAKWGE